jgi:AAA ATPase domain
MGSQTTSIPALLERESELEELARAVAGAREGAGRVVLVEGPAGVGKSRLLASVRASASEAGLQVLGARGAVLERDFAFGIARQLFEQTVLAATGAERQALFARRRWRSASSARAAQGSRRGTGTRSSARCTGCTG